MKLVYYTFCPFSRALRIALLEKNIQFSLDILNPWESMQESIVVSPVGSIPLIQDEIDGHKFKVISAFGVYEYLEEAYHDQSHSLYGDDVLIRTEIRRLIAWMDSDFFEHVSSKLIKEKIISRINNAKFPDSSAIIEAFKNLPYHMEYIDFLTGKRKWLAGNEFSMADIVAGAHISILDYLGDINWVEYPNAKDWYSKLKSRPSFQEMLDDQIGSIIPSKNYRNLDF